MKRLRKVEEPPTIHNIIFELVTKCSRSKADGRFRARLHTVTSLPDVYRCSGCSCQGAAAHLWPNMLHAFDRTEQSNILSL